MALPLSLSKLNLTESAKGPEKRPREGDDLAGPDSARTRLAKVSNIIRTAPLTRILPAEDRKLIQDIPAIVTQARIESAQKKSALPPGSPDRGPRDLSAATYDSPQVEAAALLGTLTGRAVTEGRNGKVITSPSAQNTQGMNTINASPWLKDAGRGLASVVPSPLKASPSIVNIDHITSPQSNGGFHYCPSDDTRWHSMRDIRQSPSGVISAFFLEKTGNPKHSSFFPPEHFPDAKTIVHGIKASRTTDYKAISSKCSLLEDTDNGFYMEGFKDPASSIKWKSVYPVFHFIANDALKRSDPVQITKACDLGGTHSDAVFLPVDRVNEAVRRVIKRPLDPNASSSQKTSPKGVSDFAFDESKMNSPGHTNASYHHPLRKTLLVDIAPELNVGVPRGILVEIDPDDYR